MANRTAKKSAARKPRKASGSTAGRATSKPAKKKRARLPQVEFLPKADEECARCGASLRWRKGSAKKAQEVPGIGFRVVASGVSTATCSACQTPHAAVGNVAAFRRNVVEGILRKPGALAPGEIRFVRKYLGLTGGQFALLIGVSREHVSHIERGHAPNLGTAPDRLVRLVVAARVDPSLKLLKGLLADLDAEIGTRSKRKAVRHAGYRVAASSRRA